MPVFQILACLAAIAGVPQTTPNAARSVHLHFEAPESTLFYNEVTVDRTVPDSYFEACGFRDGYFGIQELGDPSKEVVIFSVWDPGKQNDPSVVSQDRRVHLISKGPGVRIGRFGGEGTGGQSFLDYRWKVGEICRFMVKSAVTGDRTAYSAYFYRNDQHKWQEIATFDTPTGGRSLSGYYSFIEDFRRDGVSATQVRKAHFGNGWVRTAEGAWIPLLRARFTGDNTTLTNNVDSGADGNRFFLQTGGSTVNHLSLNGQVEIAPVEVGLP